MEESRGPGRTPLLYAVTLRDLCSPRRPSRHALKQEEEEGWGGSEDAVVFPAGVRIGFKTSGIGG
jgi:hypothetical protein